MGSVVNDREHHELKGLLGAYALNAMSALERRRVEKHLKTCAECAHEASLLGEVAAELSWLPGREESGGLVDEIVAALPPRPRRAWTRTAAALAAVSVAAAGFLGVALVRERSRNDDVSAVLAGAHSTVRLAPQGGFEGGGTLYVSDGGAVVVLEGVPTAGSGRTYQLWAIAGSKPASMGVVDGGGRIVRMLDWRGRADSFAVTIEPAGGSPVPTSDPVLVGA
jgi:anti-sigma-K factor RskA